MKALDVAFPVKGVLSDPPPSEVASGGAQVVENAIVTPGEIRPRLGVQVGYNYGVPDFAPSASVHVNGVTGVFLTHAPAYLPQGTPWGSESPEIPGVAPGFGGPSLPPPPPGAPPDFVPGKLVTFKAYTDPEVVSLEAVYDASRSEARYQPNRLVVTDDTAWWTDGTRMYGWAGARYDLKTSYSMTTAAALTNGAKFIQFTGMLPSGTNFIDWFVTVDGEAQADNYAYRISSREFSYTNNFNLRDGYGMGNPAIPTLPAGSTVMVTPIATSLAFLSPGAISDVGPLAVWKERLFFARPSRRYTGIWNDKMVSGVAWSYPGNATRWVESNYAVFSELQGRAITALAPSAGGLLVFTATDVGILTGADESSFQFRLLTSDLGCVDAGGVASSGGRVYWESGYGLYSSDGRSITPLSSMTCSAMRAHELNVPLPSNHSAMPVSPRITVSRDHLYYVRVPMGVGAAGAEVPPVWVCNLATGAWSSLTSGPGGAWTPLVFQDVEGSLLGLTRGWVADYTYAYRPWHYTQSGPLLDGDEGYTGGVVSRHGVSARVTFTVAPGGRDTVRLREAEVHHSTYYGGAEPDPRNGWFLDVTPDYSGVTTRNTVRSRFISGASRFDPSTYLSDKLTGLGDGEGTVFRVSLSTDTSQAFVSNHISRRVLGVRFYFDASATHTGRVNSDPIY